MNNLELWEKVRRVPTEHLKNFNNGRFSGTAIKPMWAIKIMTENFGPMGTGWGVADHSFQIVETGDSKLVQCTVCIWYTDKDKRVIGMGGDWAVRNGKGDDDAFKKAYTDAIGNALKFLGVAADIHMGLWDGNKYGDAPPAEKPPIKAIPKAEARPEYTRMSENIKIINDTGTIEDLRLFYKNNVKTIESFDQGWQQQIMKEFDDAVAALKAKAA